MLDKNSLRLDLFIERQMPDTYVWKARAMLKQGINELARSKTRHCVFLFFNSSSLAAEDFSVKAN